MEKNNSNPLNPLVGSSGNIVPAAPIFPIPDDSLQRIRPQGFENIVSAGVRDMPSTSGVRNLERIRPQQRSSGFENIPMEYLAAAGVSVLPPPIFPTQDNGLGFELDYDLPPSHSIPPPSHNLPPPSHMRNLSLPSSSGSILPASSIFLDDYLRFELDQLAQVIDMNQRYNSFFANAINLVKNKDQELKNVMMRNMELKKRKKQLALEAKMWENRAKHYESMLKVVEAKLQQVMSNKRHVNADQGLEGLGDSESYTGPNGS